MLPTSASTFPEYAQKYGDQIGRALDDFTRYGDGCPDSLQDAIRHIVLAPGKRLRPMLVLMATE
ncbi:MAG: polyprenyl synthetase family protein, partial [Pirellulaceae bacterium]